MKKLIIISKQPKLNKKQTTKDQNKKIYDLSNLNHYKIFFSHKKGFVVLSEEAAFVSRWVLRAYKEKGFKIIYRRQLNKNGRRMLYRHVVKNGKMIERICIIKLKNVPINIKNITAKYVIK